MEINFDPLKRFPTASPIDILESLGILPMWAIDSIESNESIKEGMIKRYAFYSGAMEGGSIDSEGIYRYPGDPPMAPLAVAKHGDEVCYFYQYAMVAVVNTKTGDQWVTRMD